MSRYGALETDEMFWRNYSRGVDYLIKNKKKYRKAIILGEALQKRAMEFKVYLECHDYTVLFYAVLWNRTIIWYR